jgi:rhodanese-related sulfurtransferase
MELYRRSILRVGAAGLVSTAGCLSDESDEEPSGGSSGSDDSDEMQRNEDGYKVVETEGQEVPLVPVEEAYEWYKDESARFVDARGTAQYEAMHVTGAVLSPAPDGRGSDDPVESWPTDQRIVAYCGCPHHLSSLRAASLLADGYEEVYAIDEGLGGWHENEYPVTGESVGQLPDPYTIEGETDPADGYAWAWHDESGHREAAPIDDEGNYVLHLRFAGVDEQSTIRVKTPSYEIERPLGELVDGVVTGP